MSVNLHRLSLLMIAIEATGNLKEAFDLAKTGEAAAKEIAAWLIDGDQPAAEIGAQTADPVGIKGGQPTTDHAPQTDVAEVAHNPEPAAEQPSARLCEVCGKPVRADRKGKTCSRLCLSMLMSRITKDRWAADLDLAAADQTEAEEEEETRSGEPESEQPGAAVARDADATDLAAAFDDGADEYFGQLGDPANGVEIIEAPAAITPPTSSPEVPDPVPAEPPDPGGRPSEMWPEDKLDELRRLRTEQGLTFLEIAARLGPDYTKGMVVGKARRLGLVTKPADAPASLPAPVKASPFKVGDLPAARKLADTKYPSFAADTPVKRPDTIYDVMAWRQRQGDSIKRETGGLFVVNGAPAIDAATLVERTNSMRRAGRAAPFVIDFAKPASKPDQSPKSKGAWFDRVGKGAE